MRDLQNLRPKGKSVGNCEDEETETSQNVPLGTIDSGSFEVLSDHGDEVEVDEPTNETTEMMPPLPLDSWFKRTETFCGKFRKPCNAEDPFLDCWIVKQEQCDAVQQMDPWARIAPKSVPDVKGCTSVNFPACSVCQKLGVYQRLPMKAPQYDISSEGEDRPIDNSNDGEWWPDEVDLNAVTIFGNMSIDSKPVATDGQRIRYREITVDSGAGESVVNPDDWPNVDLKPSKGSVKGQRYVGPGGEKTDNLGELVVKFCTARHGGGDISSRMTLQGTQVRKPGLAVSVSLCFFDGGGFFTLPISCAGVASVRRAITGVQGRTPVHAKNGVFVLRTCELEDKPSTVFRCFLLKCVAFV